MKTLLIPYTHFQDFTGPVDFTKPARSEFIEQTAYVISNKKANEFYSPESLPQEVVEEFFAEDRVLSKKEEKYLSISTRLVYLQLNSRDFFQLADRLSQYPELAAGVTNMFDYIPGYTPKLEPISSNTQYYTKDPSVQAAAGVLLDLICFKFTKDEYLTPVLIEQELFTGDSENIEAINKIAKHYAIFALTNDDTVSRGVVNQFWQQGYNVSGVITTDEDLNPVHAGLNAFLKPSNTMFVYVTTRIQELLDDELYDVEVFDYVSVSPMRFCVTTDSSVWDSPEFSHLVSESDPTFITKNVSEVAAILTYFKTEHEKNEKYPSWITENYYVCYPKLVTNL